MNANVPAVLQPLNQHLQAILRERIPQLGRLLIIMAEIACGVVLLDPAPTRSSRMDADQDMAIRNSLFCFLTCPGTTQLADVEDLH